MFFLFFLSLSFCVAFVYKPHLFGMQDSRDRGYVFFIPVFLAFLGAGPPISFGYFLVLALLTLILMLAFILLHALTDFILKREVRFRFIKKWSYIFGSILSLFFVYISFLYFDDQIRETGYLNLTDIVPGKEASHYTGSIVKGRCMQPSILSASQTSSSIYCEQDGAIVNLVYTGGEFNLRGREYFDFEGVVRDYEFRGGVVMVEIEFK